MRGPSPILMSGLAIALVIVGCHLHFDVDSVPPPTASNHGGPDGQYQPPDVGPIPDCDELGLEECQGRCRDLQTDPYFCGSCLERCHTTERCEQGGCVPTACPFDPGPTPGSCDPVRHQGCDVDTQACILTYFPATARFGTACEALSNLVMDVPAGGSCTSVTDCVENTSCVTWDSPDPRSRVCSQICHLDTSEGCGEDEFCVNPFARETNDQGDDVHVLTGLGFCTRRCSPTNLNTCPPGQACVPDAGYGDYACHANFRCMENAGFSDKTVMSPCDRSDLHRNGCPSGLICVPDDTIDRCMRPCSTDTQCSPGSCSPAQSPWDFLKICRP
ncbi:MAG: hypothetical protein ACNA8W_11140 [Bradymonadaceae bacterium]